MNAVPGCSDTNLSATAYNSSGATRFGDGEQLATAAGARATPYVPHPERTTPARDSTADVPMRRSAEVEGRAVTGRIS
jgi:hypothetical protein